MSVSKYVAVAKADVLEKASYGWDQFLRGLIIAIILYVFIHIWQSIYAGKPTIEGFTIPQMIWYLAMAEVILFSTGTELIETMGDQIKDGAIGNALLKPMHYLIKEAAVMFGKFLYEFSTIGIVAFILATLLVGPLQMDLVTLPLTLLVVVGAALLNIVIVLTLCVGALWFEDVHSVYFVYQKMIFILGGMLIPLDVYPAWLRQWLIYLPMSFTMYQPASLFVRFSWDRFGTALLGQAVWIVIIGTVLILLYNRGVRKVSINGG